MTNDSIQEDPDSLENKMSIWKVVVFVLLGTFIVLILLGIFRFFAVMSYGGF